MPLPLIDADELGRLLPMPAAIEALERSFAEPELPDAPQRTRVEVDAGELLVMPAAGHIGVGVKMVTLASGNPGRGLPFVQAAYVLFDADTLSPEAVIDGTALTTFRTAAVSGLATRHLARPEASRLVIFGAGATATTHLDAMVAVRPIRSLTVVSRSPGPAQALAARGEAMGLDAGTAGPEAVGQADLVCTCTTSDRPVFEGSRLQAGAHVNAIGAYRPDMRELDDQAVARARVVVETREAALAEAGDLLIPIRAGRIGADHIVAELADVVRGAPVRRRPDDVTVFKSVGIAPEDLAVARAAVDARG